MLFWQLCFRTYFVVCLQDYKRIVGDVGRGNYCSRHAVLLTLRPLCFHFNQLLLGPSLQSVLPFIHNYYCCSLIMLLHLRRMLKPVPCILSTPNLLSPWTISSSPWKAQSPQPTPSTRRIQPNSRFFDFLLTLGIPSHTNILNFLHLELC